MTISLQSTGCTSSLYSPSRPPHPSPRNATKVSAGLKIECSLGFQKPYSIAVQKSMKIRTSDSKPRRLRIVMMPMTPIVRVVTDRYVERMDLWNALYRDRVVFIGNYITENYSNKILATMLYLDSIDNTKLLSVLINGVGGDIIPSLLIYDTMQILRSPIGTRCVGSAYNLSAFLLAAGDKGFRLGMPMSRIAIQPLAGSAQGKVDDIVNESYELLRFRDYLHEELAKKTGHPLEKINQDFKMGKYFGAKEAVEYGLIDDIVRPVVKNPPQRKLGLFGI